MFGLTSLVQRFCVHRDKYVLKMRLTLFVLFWLEGGLAEVWQATLNPFFLIPRQPKNRSTGICFLSLRAALSTTCRHRV